MDLMRKRVTWAVAFTAAVAGVSIEVAAAVEIEPAPLVLEWHHNILTIHRPAGASDPIPGGEIQILYIEAYCRPGSTNRDWGRTTIGHRTEVVGGKQRSNRLQLRCTLKDGVIVDHDIRGMPSAVEFELTVHNPTNRESHAD